MKKIFSLIAAFILITGCDDGDMSYKTFDFTGINPIACTNNNTVGNTSETHYKINGTEGLILVLAPGTLINEPTLDPETNEQVPYTITLNTSNTLTYKNFASAPNAAGLCNMGNIPDALETWIGTGTLSVMTFAKTTDGILTGYTHQITMLNVSFKNGDETITINNNLFGNVDKDYDFVFNFNVEPNDEPLVQQCPDIVTNFIYTVKDREILLLSFEDFAAAFPTTIGEQTIILGDDNNLTFTMYDGTLTASTICATGGQVPITPKSIQQWVATAGSAIITTTEGVGQYIHDIRLKDVILTNTTTGEEVNLSDIAAKDEDGNYYYGKYSS